MEKRSIDNLNTELKMVMLSSEEKATMKSRLVSFMNEHPLPIPSDDWYGIRSPLHMKSLQVVRVAFSALVITALIGGSVAAAAEGSLPGDALYSVKVNINEPMRGAVTVSPKGKAVWDAQRAARRLEEAEKLAVKGELDADTTLALEAKFEEHAEKSIARAQESNDPAIKAAVHSEIEATLEAHSTVIKNLMDTNEALEEGLESVRVVVAERAEASEDARMAAEDELTSATSTVDETQLKEQKWDLKEDLDAIERTLDRFEDDIDPSLFDDIDARFDAAEYAFNKGKELLKEQQLDEALVMFQRAERGATQAEVLLSLGEILADAKAEEDAKLEAAAEAEAVEGAATSSDVSTEQETTESSIDTIATSTVATSTDSIATTTFQKIKTELGF